VQPATAQPVGELILSNHADAIAQHAKAIGQLAVVKGIVDQGGGGDFGQEHKSLMVTGRESVNDLIDVFIAAMKKVRDDEIAKRREANTQLGLSIRTSTPPTWWLSTADRTRPATASRSPRERRRRHHAVGDVYWQVLEHSETHERYAVQVRPSEENPTSPRSSLCAARRACRAADAGEPALS